MSKNFNDLLQEYFEYISIKLKPQSVISIKGRFKYYILPYFKYKNIDDITPVDYLNWQKEMNSKALKYSYKKALHYSMVGFYSYLQLFYQIRNNIPRQVGNFLNNEIKKDMEIWTIEEYRKFEKSFEEKDFIYKCFFALLFFTGIREGEAIALNFNDFNFNDNLLYINKTLSKSNINGKRTLSSTKTKCSVRYIKLDNYTSNLIKQLKELYTKKFGYFEDNFYIFGGKKPISISSAERRKNKYTQLAQIKKIRIHDFRHSHATLLINHDIPIIEVSRRLGHSDINTTVKTYCHLDKKHEKKVFDTLNSINKTLYKN